MELTGFQIEVVKEGTRAEMLALERKLIQIAAGPANKEMFAGRTLTKLVIKGAIGQVLEIAGKALGVVGWLPMVIDGSEYAAAKLTAYTNEERNQFDENKRLEKGGLAGRASDPLFKNEGEEWTAYFGIR